MRLSGMNFWFKGSQPEFFLSDWSWPADWNICEKLIPWPAFS